MFKPKFASFPEYLCPMFRFLLFVTYLPSKFKVVRTRVSELLVHIFCHALVFAENFKLII